MILHDDSTTIEIKESPVFCCNPFAKCQETGKRLFLRQCIRLDSKITRYCNETGTATHKLFKSYVCKKKWDLATTKRKGHVISKQNVQ